MVQPVLLFKLGPNQPATITQKLFLDDPNDIVAVERQLFQNGAWTTAGWGDPPRASWQPIALAPLPETLLTHPQLQFTAVGTYHYQITTGTVEQHIAIQVYQFQIIPPQAILFPGEVQLQTRIRNPLNQADASLVPVWKQISGPTAPREFEGQTPTVDFPQAGIYQFQVTLKHPQPEFVNIQRNFSLEIKEAPVEDAPPVVPPKFDLLGSPLHSELLFQLDPNQPGPVNQKIFLDLLPNTLPEKVKVQLQFLQNGVWSIPEQPSWEPIPPAPIPQQLRTNPIIPFSTVGIYRYQITVEQITRLFEVEVYQFQVIAPQEVTLPEQATVEVLLKQPANLPQLTLVPIWRQVSGPAAVTTPILNETRTISFFQSGTYVFEVLLSSPQGNTSALINARRKFSIQVKASVPINLPPVVEAGPDQIVNLPNGVLLQATVSDDGLPNPPGRVATRWRQVGDGNPVVFSNPTLAETSAVFADKGRYLLTLTADDGEKSTRDELVITVNKAPVIQVNAPGVVVLPGTAALSAQVVDDGLGDPAVGNLTPLWAKVSGPGNVTFSNQTMQGTVAIATATFSENGRYGVRCMVNNGYLTTAQDITILASLTPLVNAGDDQGITLPATALLKGQVQTDGWNPSRTLQVAWSKVEGPGLVTFEGQGSQARACFSEPGQYILRLTATDGSLTASDEVLITVNPPVILPRITRDLTALYTFQEGSGSTIRDVSAVGSPLNLTIGDRPCGTVIWLPGGGLGVSEQPATRSGEIPKSPTLQTSGPATKVIRSVKQTNQLTVEVWYRPGSDRPIYLTNNPIRILTLATRGGGGHQYRNLTLQQGQWQTTTANFYHVRINTTAEATNAEDGLKTPAGLIQRQGDAEAKALFKRNHIVYTWDGAGTGRLYVDGILAQSKTFPPPKNGWQKSLSGWNDQYPLALSKDPDGDWPGRGEFYLVALYSRALTAEEILQNFQAGVPVSA